MVGSARPPLRASYKCATPPQLLSTSSTHDARTIGPGGHRESSDSLRNALEFYSLDGPPEYQPLVERGEIEREIARKDLLDGFHRIRDESYQRLERAEGAEVADRYVQKFEEYKAFLTRMFSAAAIAALATQPTTEDVAVARPFLNDYLSHEAALRIIVSKGTATDVDDLMDIARSSFGHDRKLALDAVQ
jgi:hypothetical protein